jgi:hypothetical protein
MLNLMSPVADEAQNKLSFGKNFLTQMPRTFKKAKLHITFIVQYTNVTYNVSYKT